MGSFSLLSCSIVSSSSKWPLFNRKHKHIRVRTAMPRETDGQTGTNGLSSSSRLRTAIFFFFFQSAAGTKLFFLTLLWPKEHSRNNLVYFFKFGVAWKKKKYYFQRLRKFCTFILFPTFIIHSQFSHRLKIFISSLVQSLNLKLTFISQNSAPVSLQNWTQWTFFLAPNAPCFQNLERRPSI